MAKQINRHIKLRGTIDEISFYKTQDGFLARAKGGVDGDRIKNDPKFRNTRFNGLEFGIGGRASKLFRLVWNPEITRAADNRVASRVTQLMVRILKTDPVSDYGERKVEFGDLSLLSGFEFNNAVPLDQAFKLPFTTTIDRVTGQASVQVPAHNPQSDIAAPDGTTHYNIFAAAAAIDFATGEVVVVRQSIPSLPWINNPVVATNMNLSLPANSVLPLFLLVGIEFIIMVNGKVYPQSKGLSALRLIALNTL